MATATCPHGFAEGSCLICQTLGHTATRTASRPADLPVDRKAERPEVLTSRPPRRSRLPLGTRLIGLAALVVAVVLVVGWVIAAIWAALRIAELVAVALVSGWVCWRLGVRHGRRHPV